MLPVIPFDVLVPLTIAATLLCLGIIAVIMGRRAAIKWWTRGGARLTEQAESLIRAVKAGKEQPEAITKWLGRTRPVRIDSLVQAVDRVSASDGDVRGWLADRSGLPTRLSEIVSAPTNGKRSKGGGRWLRVTAARAVGYLHFPSALPALVKAMDDEDTEVGYAAADAIGRLDLPEGADAILQRISVKPHLNNSRLAALLESMSCDLTEVFRTHLRRTDSQALFWTATLVGQKEVFDLLVEVRPLLHSEDGNVRAAACECVGELKIPLTDRWLAPLVKDQEWYVKSHAARALGELRATWAVDDLVELIYSNEWWVRQNAADALVKIGKDAAEPVEKVLWSEDRFARNTAVEILDRVGWIHQVVDRAVRDDARAESLLRQFGVSGGLGYLENALFTASEDGIPILLGILRELGDDASYGRLRAAAEQMPERFRPMAQSIAMEVKSR